MRFAVIGATHGLGLALTKTLLDEGHKVAAGTLDREVPDTLKPLIEQYGDNILVGRADVTNEEEIKAFAKSTTAFFDKVDAVCTVAGIMLPEDRKLSLLEAEISNLRTTFDVNFIGPVTVAKYFYPIIEKGGKLLTITSEGVGVRYAWSGSPHYALSKTAVTKVAGILNSTVDDVDFYSVHPGRPMTLMNRNGEIPAEESAAGIFKIMAGQTPVSRESWYIDYLGNSMDNQW
jgi:NAD(P)-dependent dehydrogenase (short-subunit alcohol dehydrogenase family)